MNLQEWQAGIRAQLTASTAFVQRMVPGMAYGSLATATLLPVIMAVKGGDITALMGLYTLLGNVGTGLVTNLIQEWKDREEAETLVELPGAITQLLAADESDDAQAAFDKLILAPFTDSQIRRFVDRWYAHIATVRTLDHSDAQGRAELLKRAIFAAPRLHELAERPLLLTLTASIHAWRGGTLPDRREELYDAAVDLLLDWWESQRVVRDEQGNQLVVQPSLVEWLKADRAAIRGVLNRLAFAAHKGQPRLVGTADIAEKDLVYALWEVRGNQAVSEEMLIEYLSQRAGLLVPRGVKVYTFPHRTFQEYLAACHLTDDEYPEQVAELVRNEPNRWREVAVLAGAKAVRGTSSAIWTLVDALCYQDPAEADYALADDWGALLAGQALLESANLEGE